MSLLPEVRTQFGLTEKDYLEIKAVKDGNIAQASLDSDALGHNSRQQQEEFQTEACERTIRKLSRRASSLGQLINERL